MAMWFESLFRQVSSLYQGYLAFCALVALLTAWWLSVAFTMHCNGYAPMFRERIGINLRYVILYGDVPYSPAQPSAPAVKKDWLPRRACRRLEAVQ